MLIEEVIEEAEEEGITECKEKGSQPPKASAQPKEQISDGSNVSADLYRPQKKAVKQSKDMAEWDKVDYTSELEKVNGDKRAVGELSKEEQRKMEMMKMYVQDPEGMEAAAKQAAQMKAMKKTG